MKSEDSTKAMFQSKINILLTSMEKLEFVLKQELDLLKQRNHQALSLFIVEKERHIKAYEHAMRMFLAEEEMIKKLPDYVKEALVETQKKLNKTIRLNALKVRAHLHAYEKYIEILKKALIKADSELNPYENPAQAFKGNKTTKKPQNVSYSINL